jgi:OOP family OmpA-OmpF porin
MFRKRFLKILVPLAMVALLIGYAMPAFSAVDLNPKLASGEYVQKVDTFEVIFDATESMNEIYKGGSKLNQEKALVTLFNDTIPNLKLTSAGRAFGDFTMFGGATSKSLFAPTAHNKSLLPQATAPFTRGKGFSPLDAGLDGATADLQSQTGRMAVIAFSDGADMQKFQPVAAAQRMKKAYGDRVCIYTVVLGDKAAMWNFGDKAEGMNIMKQVADAGECGIVVTGDSISSPEGMAAFVEKVFLDKDSDRDGVGDSVDKCPDTPQGCPVDKDGCPLDSDGDGVIDCLDKCPDTPKGVAVDKDGCPPVEEKRPEPAAAVEPKAEAPVMMTLHILFASDKYNIQPKYESEIKKVADYMKANPDVTAVVAGHTDSTHSNAYNKKLSQNRANAVKTALVEKYGIDASRIEAVGYGEDKPIATNKTKAGRQKNRRVVVMFN